MVVENSGAGNATSVTATDVVPANTTYVTCTGGASCNQAAGTVTWNIGTLAPGATATISYTVATSSAPAVSDTDYTISNTAQVSSTQTAPVSSNTVTNTLRVKPTIVKSVSRDRGPDRRPAHLHAAGLEPGRRVHRRHQRHDPDRRLLHAASAAARRPARSPAAPCAGTAPRSRPARTPSASRRRSPPAAARRSRTRARSTRPRPNLAPIASNTVQTEVGPMLDLIKFVNPVGQVERRRHAHVHARADQRLERGGDRRRRHRPVPAYTTYVNGSCTTPPGHVQPRRAASSRGPTATCRRARS